MKIVVRRYTQEDIPQINQLTKDFQNYLAGIDTNDQVRRFDDSDAKIYSAQLAKDVEQMNGAYFVAEDNGKLIGFIQGIINDHKKDPIHNLIHKPSIDGWIGVLFIQDEYRGKGLSRLLIGKIINYFKEKKCTTVKLLVSSDNAVAKLVYEKLGFKTHDIQMTLKI